MIRRLIILLLIVGCGTEPEENSTCILVDDDFGICTEELNEAECYSFSSYPSPFLHILWSNTQSCSELNYTVEFDLCGILDDDSDVRLIEFCNLEWLTLTPL